MHETIDIHGFPLFVNGSRKFTSSQSWLCDDAHLSALGQLLECTLLDVLGRYSGNIDMLSESIIESIHSDRLSPYLDTVFSARLTDVLLEIDFSAVGYPDRYTKSIRLDGPRGCYKLSRRSQSKSDISTIYHWIQSQNETSCIVEAFDSESNTTSRVTITLEIDSGSGFESYSSIRSLRNIEYSVCKIARDLLV